MSELVCHIDSLRFDIAAPSVASARALQQRLSGFARGPLLPVLEAVLAQTRAGRGSVLEFARIELDLGELDDSRLERQLSERLARALSDYLQRQGVLRRDGRAMLAAPQRPAGGEAGSEADSEAGLPDLAAFFNGAGTPAAGAALVALALRQWPEQLLRMLRGEGRRQAVRQRLVLALPQPLIAQMIALLEPNEAPLIVAYVAEVCQLHRQRPLVPESRQHFRAVLWEFVFAYLLLERGSYFNSKALVGHTLRQMAHRYRVDYDALLEQLNACLLLPQLAPARGHGLAAILSDLRHENRAPHAGVAAPAFSERSLLSEQLAALAGFFERGVVPGGAGDVAMLVDDICASAAAQLQVLLRRIGHQPHVRQRLAFQLGEAQQRQVAAALEPEHGAWICASIDSIAELQRRKAVLREDPWRLRRQLWQLVFCVLLDERGSWFNTRAFIKSLLLQMAARYRVAYRVLLQELIGLGLAPLAATRRQRGLPAILLSLRQEMPAAIAPAAAGATAPPGWTDAVRGVLLRATLDGPGAVRAALQQAARRCGAGQHDVLHALLVPQGALPPLLRQRDAVHEMLLALGAELPQLPPAGGRSARRRARPPETVAAMPPRFARAAREFAIRSLRLQRGSHFNNRSFIRSMLEQLSARHDIAYDQLLRGLIAQSGAAATAILPQTTLPAILLSLRREVLASGATAAVAPAAAFPAARADTDPALYFLEFGAVPRGAGLPAAQQDALREDGLWRHDGVALARVLRDAAQRSGALERLLRHAAPAQLADVLRALSPDFAGFAETCVLALLAPCAAAPWPRVRAELSVLAWRALLRIVLASADGKVGPAALTDALVAALAPRLGLNQVVFRARWLARARAGAHPRFEVLASLLAPYAPPRATSPRIATPRAAAASAAPPDAPPDAPALLALLLRHGVPAALAHAPGSSAQDLMATLALALQRQPARFRAVLARAAGRVLERHRIAHLLPPALRRQVLALLLGEHAGQSAWWQAALARALSAQTGERGWHGVLDEELLRVFARDGAHGCAPSRFLPALLERLGQRHAIAPAAVLRALRQEAAGTPAAAATRGLLDTLARHVAEDDPPAPDGAAQTTTEMERKMEKDLPLHERFMVDNGGVVLLWPFLDRYFNLLGLQQNGVFLSDSHQWRAVHLLRYLSHGSIEAPEAALLLNKVLCGVDSAAPLEPGGPLTEHERDVSGQILSAVTQNWSKLKNTDAEGLRSAFLRRGAQLVREEHHWSLLVERSALDVLLPSLPWALGTIKLSWMERIVKVSW